MKKSIKSKNVSAQGRVNTEGRYSKVTLRAFFSSRTQGKADRNFMGAVIVVS
jgi:hypothetical protein